MSKIKLWHHIKRFKFNSMLVRDFAIIFLFMLVISTATSQGFYHYYKNLTAEAVSESNTGALGRVMDFIDLVSNEAESLSYRISNDSVITDFLKTDLDGVGISKTIARIDMVRKVLNTSAFADDYLQSVELYSIRNDFFVSPGMSCRISRSNMEIPQINPDKDMWISVSGDYSQNELCLNFFQKVYLQGSKEVAGIVAVVIDLEIFGQQIRRSTSRNYEEIFLLDKDNNILFATTPATVGKKANDVMPLELYDENSGADTIRYNGYDVFVTCVVSGYRDWKCISFTAPENYYGSQGRRLESLLIGSIIISFIIAVTGALWISMRVFTPINMLLELVQQEKRFPGKRNKSGELEIIISNILDNYEQNNKMKQQLLDKQIMLGKAQNIALQAQINPHFLYNTLENINWKVMALTKDNNDGAQMIAMLSQLLRFYLKTEEAVITVREEINYAKLYMDILYLRFGDAYKVYWEIEDSLMDSRIVKVTLQPLLENAVNYGAIKGDGNDFVRINGYSKDNKNIIEIINSGPCVSDDELRQINKKLESSLIQENSSIGMSNVNLRLKLHFGNQYGLAATRTSEGYTCVSITFPI